MQGACDRLCSVRGAFDMPFVVLLHFLNVVLLLLKEYGHDDLNPLRRPAMASISCAVVRAEGVGEIRPRILTV